MSMCILGFSVNFKVAGWCKVFHQFTEYLMMGMFTNPTNETIPAALKPVSALSNTQWMTMTPKYKKNSTSIEVKRASQIHQVPQVGFPHTAPVKSAIKQKAAPRSEERRVGKESRYRR